jgi:predicted nucleic acid-binding Zn ribbon protein
MKIEQIMPKYNYICSTCGAEYSETRLSDQPQWHTECPKHWCNGTVEEITNE